MIERRTRKRVNYFASDKNMQKCVMTAWLSVIKKNEYSRVAFTLVEGQNEGKVLDIRNLKV